MGATSVQTKVVAALVVAGALWFAGFLFSHTQSDGHPVSETMIINLQASETRRRVDEKEIRELLSETNDRLRRIEIALAKLGANQ